MELLNLSKNSVYEALRDGTIPNRKVGKRFIIPKAAIDKWLMSGAATPAK